MKTITLGLFALAALSICSCKHDATDVAGKGGNATVVLYPQHHGVAFHLITGKLYVKYNTSNAPSNGIYDDSVACVNHDSLISGAFTGLKNGNYYFYTTAYDTSIAQNVKGAMPYTITQQVSQNVNLPVSE
jgi:hypothetical protein